MRSFLMGFVQYMLMAMPVSGEPPRSYYYKFLIERLSFLLDASDLKMLTINTCLQDFQSNRRFLNKAVQDFFAFAVSDGWRVELSVMEVSIRGYLHLHFILNNSPSYHIVRSLWKETDLLPSRASKHVHLENIKSVKATLQYLSKQMAAFQDFVLIM